MLALRIHFEHISERQPRINENGRETDLLIQVHQLESFKANHITTTFVLVVVRDEE